MSDLQKSITKTLGYFDLRSHPLTLIEIKIFLLRDNVSLNPSVEEIFQSVQSLMFVGRILEKDGYFCLAGREEIFNVRTRCYPLYMERMQKTARLIKFLRYVPFIRGIAITGSMAGLYAKKESDIDFLVITKENRIWLARLLLSLVTQVLGVRRHGRLIANRICLNHYRTEDAEVERPDNRNLYTAIEYASLAPLLNAPAFDKFVKEQQSWASHFLDCAPEVAERSVLEVRSSRLLQPFLEFVYEAAGAFFWERLSGKLQRSRIEVGGTVYVSNKELSFHPHSRATKLIEGLETGIKNS